MLSQHLSLWEERSHFKGLLKPIREKYQKKEKETYGVQIILTILIFSPNNSLIALSLAPQSILPGIQLIGVLQEFKCSLACDFL